MGSTDKERQPSITIDGRPVDMSAEGGVEEVTVDDDLGLPGMFAITIRQGDDNEEVPLHVGVGAKVEIHGPGGMIDTPLVSGEVTTITGDYGPHGRRAIIRGYDVSHRLHRGRQTRTYVNTTDSDICTTIADAAGIDVGEIDSTDTTHDHVSQANQSDWEFLKARARRIGYEVFVDDGKLYFKKPPESSSAPDEGNLRQVVWSKLVLGQELIEYHPRITGSEQVARVEVRGWDHQNKTEVVGQANAGTVAAQTQKGSPTAFAQTFGNATFVAADSPVLTVDEADATATAIAEHISSAYAESEGIARGNSDLRAGTSVNISGVPDVFAGRFVLTHTRHVFNINGYRTHFEISGRQRRSLLGLVSLGTQTASVGNNGKVGSSAVYGVVVGVVTGNNDPSAQGRVKVKFPWLDGNYESTWAPVVQASAGPDSGAVFIPEVGDTVLVSFDNGDVSQPYVIGGLYNGVDKPRLGENLFDNGKVKRRGFVSRMGHRLVFLDDDQVSGIGILSSDGKLRVALNESGQVLHVYGDKKVVVESGDELDFKASKISVRADSDLTLRAGKMTIKSDGVVDVDGAVIELN